MPTNPNTVPKTMNSGNRKYIATTLNLRIPVGQVLFSIIRMCFTESNMTNIGKIMENAAMEKRTGYS